MPTDPVDSDLRLVVTFVRDAVASNAAVMRPDGDRRADSYAMAGLAHCCVLLELAFKPGVWVFRLLF